MGNLQVVQLELFLDPLPLLALHPPLELLDLQYFFSLPLSVFHNTRHFPILGLLNHLFTFFVILLSLPVFKPLIAEHLSFLLVLGLVHLVTLLFYFLSKLLDIRFDLKLSSSQYFFQASLFFFLFDLSLELALDLHRSVLLETRRQLTGLGMLLDHELVDRHLSEEIEADEHVLPRG